MTESLATRFDISRRGIVIDSILCGNCDIGVETTSHLFFTCDMATSVRRLINRWWEVPDMEIDSYATWKGWIVTIRMASKTKLMFEGVYYVMWWDHLVVSYTRNFEEEVGSNMNRICEWDDIISKVSSRLSKWKLKTLSIGVRCMVSWGNWRSSQFITDRLGGDISQRVSLLRLK
ncbi:hypothetical protein Tco_0721012, partial [Tanacetum coccineum]